MVDAAEDPGIYTFRYVIDLLKFLDIAQIKLQRAGNVGIDGTGREVAISPFVVSEKLRHDIFVFRNNDVAYFFLP